MSRYSFILPIVAIMLTACDSPSAPVNKKVYLMQAELLPSPTETPIGIIFSNSEMTEKEMRFGDGLEKGAVKAVILAEHDTAHIMATPNFSTGIEPSNGVKPTFQFLTDWAAQSSSGVKVGGMEIYFLVDGYSMDDSGRMSLSLPGSVEKRQLRTVPAEATIELPSLGSSVWFVYPVQVWYLQCSGNGSIVVSSRNGMVSKIEHGGPWYSEPAATNVPPVRITCTQYESVAAARVALLQQ